MNQAQVIAELERLKRRCEAFAKKIAKCEKLLASKQRRVYDSVVATMQSEGGKARAKKLTAERKQEIARKAAAARWSKRGGK